MKMKKFIGLVTAFTVLLGTPVMASVQPQTTTPDAWESNDTKETAYPCYEVTFVKR